MIWWAKMGLGCIGATCLAVGANAANVEWINPDAHSFPWAWPLMGLGVALTLAARPWSWT